MKNFITAALLVGGAVLASQSALAQATANNLYMGFQNQAGNANEDYIINLGAASNIVGGSSVVTLSSDFSISDFNAVLSTSSNVQGGVVGVFQSSSNPDMYATQLRSALGTPATPGSTAPAPTSKSIINDAASPVLGGLDGPAVGTGVLDTGKSWESVVEPGTAPLNFYGQSGVNPDSTIAPASVVYEDLWYVADNSLSGVSNWIYEGYFTLDLTGGSPKLTFTPTNAPATLVPPVIVSVTKTGSTVTLISTNAVSTHSYQLQYTASLNPTNWINVGSSQVAGTTMVTNTDTSATSTNRFYRIMAQ
jgi:hypothetical protein